MKFDKFKTNLSYDSEYVYSYGTKVGKIEEYWIRELGYWSITTRKHLNYAARILNKRVEKYE